VAGALPSSQWRLTSSVARCFEVIARAPPLTAEMRRSVVIRMMPCQALSKYQPGGLFSTHFLLILQGLFIRSTSTAAIRLVPDRFARGTVGPGGKVMRQSAIEKHSDEGMTSRRARETRESARPRASKPSSASLAHLRSADQRLVLYSLLSLSHSNILIVIPQPFELILETSFFAIPKYKDTLKVPLLGV
jgi:hypothetical protein